MKNNNAIILILLSAGLLYTFIMPQWDEVKALEAQQDMHKETLANASSIINLRDQLIGAYRSFPESDIDRIEKILPNSADLVGLAYEIDGIASNHGISIESVNIGERQGSQASSIIEEEATPTHKSAGVSVSFVSNYPNFSSFLADLEKSLRILDVRSVSFSVSDETGLYEHHIEFDTYWLE